MLARRSRCGGLATTGPKDYQWPLKPFRMQHPIRGAFGDPRTASVDAFGVDGPGLPGDYSFHNGVDIVASAGTPVYPVVSGIAHVRSGDEVTVHAGARAFQYQHIRPAVRDNEHVVAGVTVLGHVLFPAGHLHLTEIFHERLVNPALHLRPYHDRTAPVVHQLEFRNIAGHSVNGVLSGRISVVAWVDDRPPVPVSGNWGGMPVGPAYVGWGLRAVTGTTSLARVAADFRHGEPPKQRFWSVYAAGTFQNFPVFDHYYYWRTPGRYLFQLTPRPLDTRHFPNGAYTVRVVARDICGNTGTLKEQVMIANRRIPLAANVPPVATRASHAGNARQGPSVTS